MVDYRVKPCSSRYEFPVEAVFGDDSRSVMILIDEFSQTMRAYSSSGRRGSTLLFCCRKDEGRETDR